MTVFVTNESKELFTKNLDNLGTKYISEGVHPCGGSDANKYCIIDATKEQVDAVKAFTANYYDEPNFTTSNDYHSKGDDKLYDWLFWFNYLENRAFAIHRDSLLNFFSGNRNEARFLKGNNFDVLKELICKNGAMDSVVDESLKS